MFREMVAYKERRGREHDRDITLAWNVAGLTRGTKDLPKLETLLTKKPRRHQQTASAQAAMWQVIAARFGGSFKPMDPKTVIRRG